MSVTIRLSRIGKTKSPAFKIVAATTRDKLDGRAVEILGHYNPSHNPPPLQIDHEKLDAWKKKGAIVSPAVAKLAEDKYEFKPYTRQNEVKEEAVEPAVETEPKVEEVAKEVVETPELETPTVEETPQE